MKGPMIPTSEMEAGIESYPGAISLLPLNWDIHREEFIKYYCREEDWKYGICQLCLYQHSEHDYIHADEVASFEIKQSLKATITEWSYKMKSQSMLYNETEKLTQFIDDLKVQEYEKIHYYFVDLHRELDKREKQLKDLYHALVKDVEAILRKDITILQNRMNEFNIIFEKLNEKAARFKMSNDLAIVANAHEVFDLQRKVKNNNFEGKRLEIDDEEPINEFDNKFEESPNPYNSGLRKENNSAMFANKENPKYKNENEENHGEHVFFVQLDSILMMPQFLINISKEKNKIESIGSIKNSIFNNKDIIYENQDQYSDRSKRVSDIINMSPEYNQKLSDQLYGNNQDESKRYINKYAKIQPSIYSKNFSPINKQNRLKHFTENERDVSDNTGHQTYITQKITETEEILISWDNKIGREMMWFKWDSFDWWKYNFKEDTWSLLEDAKPNQKFLYFSSTVHLKNNNGWYILGGWDFEDNYSRRALHFEGYKSFKDKTPMISKRAFFSSWYWDIDDSIYVFGGNDSLNDLNQWERYSLTENVWRQISPLNWKRNGASSMLMPDANWIFVFGGNNKEEGSMNSIEKYEIEYDKWTLLAIRMKYPLHDLTSVYLGGYKVMILGGNNEDGISKAIEIKDLSSEANKLSLKFGGKWYFNPMIDENGTLHCFFGYGDSQLVNESVDIKDLLQNPIIQKNKITKTENIPAHSVPTPSLQNYNRIPRPRQMKDNTKELRSSNSLQRIIGRRDNMEFNMYNPINDSQSPMYSTDLNIPPNIYSEKVKNIRSIRAQMNNPDINSKYNMQYDNFFHLRNSPKNVSYNFYNFMVY